MRLRGLRGTTVQIPRSGSRRPTFKPTDLWGYIVADARQHTYSHGFNKHELKGLKGVSVPIPIAPSKQHAEKSLHAHVHGEQDPTKVNELLRGMPAA